jgi:hypothetical protein
MYVHTHTHTYIYKIPCSMSARAGPSPGCVRSGCKNGIYTLAPTSKLTVISLTRDHSEPSAGTSLHSE